jgi:hypothetical protein
MGWVVHGMWRLDRYRERRSKEEEKVVKSIVLQVLLCLMLGAVLGIAVWLLVSDDEFVAPQEPVVEEDPVATREVRDSHQVRSDSESAAAAHRLIVAREVELNRLGARVERDRTDRSRRAEPTPEPAVEVVQEEQPVAEPRVEHTHPEPEPVAPEPAPEPRSGDPNFQALAQCESGGRNVANPSGKYRGYFQFDLQTWASVGMSGDPMAHSYAVQEEGARRLFAARGRQPWPHCGRYL